MNKIKHFSTKRLHLALMVIGLLAAFPPDTLLAEEKTLPNSALTIPTSNIEDKPLAKPDSPISPNTADGQTKKSLNLPLLANPWIALATVLIFFLGGVWLLKRFQPGSNRLFGSLPVLQVLGRTHLSAKQTLVMVKVDTKLLLLGITDHQINPLMTFDSPEEVSHILTQIEQARPAGISSGFKHLFSNENSLLQQDAASPTPLSDPSSDKNTQNSVLQLKNELNTLLLKVQKLKRNGGDDPSV